MARQKTDARKQFRNRRHFWTRKHWRTNNITTARFTASYLRPRLITSQ